MFLRKFAFVSMVLCLFIAIPLSLMGIRHVDLGTPFLAFMKNVSNQLNTYKLEIPNIPLVPSPESLKGAWLIVDILVKVVNFIVMICNLAINVVNTIIQFVQMIFLVVKGLITLKDDLSNQTSSTFMNANALLCAIL